MKLLKLSALAFATSIALTGCGSDNDDNSPDVNTDIPTKPPTDTDLSELDQAKELVRTAHNFVSDAQEIQEVYENIGDILTSQQEARLNTAFHIPQDLMYYMENENLSMLTSSDIIGLADDSDFKTAIGSDYQQLILTPSSDFVAKLSSDGQFILDGSVDVSKGSGQMQDDYLIVFNNYSDALQSNTETDDFKGGFSFDSIKVGTGAETALLEAKDGLKVHGKFTDSIVPDSDLDLDAEQENGVFLEKGEFELDSLTLTANGNVVEVKDLAFAMLDITKDLADGTTVATSMPYHLQLTGDFKTDLPKTDVAITLNAKASDEDIKNYITLDGNEDLQEDADEYVDMSILLAVKGDMTKDNAMVIPLDFQANLERTARDIITLENLKASVDGKALYVTGQTKLNDDYDVVNTTLVIAQNDASITLTMDEEGEFDMDNMGKLADIMVNEEDYGDLMDNNGAITAKFSDNSLITL